MKSDNRCPSCGGFKDADSSCSCSEPEAPVSAVEDISQCTLHRRTPYIIQDVSMSHFSIARYYGGADFNGDKYIYVEETDELVRVDVMEWRNKRKVQP